VNPREVAPLKLLILWFMVAAATLMPERQDAVGSAQRGRVQAITASSHVGEDVMAAKRRWGDLSEGTRKLIIVTAVADSILKGAALIDIKRRPADQIRGPKWLWVPVVAVVNSAGVVPISYFIFGRRRPPSQPG
jgi:hypothetical protein